MNCIACRKCIDEDVYHCICDDIIVRLNVNLRIGEENPSPSNFSKGEPQC